MPGSPASNARLSLAVTMIVMVSGCRGSDIEKAIVQGTVTVDGVPVDRGEIRFVPIEQTLGPISAAIIETGSYRIADRGGVPLGKHRVEVAAYRKTGRKVPSPRGVDMVDELVLVVPEKYTTAQSPMVVEVTAETAGELDIKIP